MITRPNILLRSWPLPAALIILLAATTVLGVAMVGASGGHLVYPLDDTYIQMAIAKNLAAHGTWGVTRFEFSGAGSSPLWPLLIAVLDRVTGLGARLPLIVNVLAGVTVVAVASAALTRHIQHRAGQFFTLMLVIVAASLPALMLVGMEHTLACAAALALAVAGVSWCAAPEPRDRRLRLAVACLGLLTVALRYDAAAIVAPLLLLIAITGGWRKAMPLAIVSALPGAAYALMAWRHGWPALPAPVLLKQRLWGLDLLSWHGAADLLGGGALTVLINTPALLTLVLVALALLAASRHEVDDQCARESRFLLIVFLAATAVHLQFGRVGWLYRYEAHLIVLGIVANASALAHQLPARWPRLAALQWGAIAALTVIAAHPLLLRGFLASRDVVTGAVDLYQHEYVWSHFFREYPPDGGLLVSDLGAVAYYTDVPIVDVGGLATLELLPASWKDPVDVPRAVRVARSRGVRISLIDGPAGPLTGWPCVAAWITIPESRPNATLWLSAADEEAASHLRRDLRAFAAAHRDGGFSLRFPSAGETCAAP